MFQVLADRTYRHLFLAQVISLAGTGLATIALGLLAFDLAGGNAGMVLGTVFTIKMVAYIGVAPFAGAFVHLVPRRALLVVLDVVRAMVALALPFVTEAWHLYVLIFVLQSASAAFTPTYQATIPDVLPEESRYTRALSLSRLAYDLENIVSPILAALLLLLIPYDALFVGTMAGFLASAAFVVSVTLPDTRGSSEGGVLSRVTRGIRIYLATPRLRGLLSLNVTVAAAGSMVLVNSVVLVRGELGLGEEALAWTMGAFGCGSMLSAFLLPRMLDRIHDRTIMLAGGVLMVASLGILAVVVSLAGLAWPTLLLMWFVLGLGYSGVLTPSGRLILRSSRSADRPAVFAAQFALSHACWLVAYPLSGWLMTAFGVLTALAGLTVLAIIGVVLALRHWPADDRVELAHRHDNLPPDHPHLSGDREHVHAFVIDDLHRHWPTAGKN